MAKLAEEQQVISTLPCRISVLVIAKYLLNSSTQKISLRGNSSTPVVVLEFPRGGTGVFLRWYWRVNTSGWELCLEDQSVVGIVEAFWKLLFLHFIQADLVAHVYEVSRDVAQASAELNGVFDGLVCLVRRMSQGSDNEQLDALEQGE